MDYYRRMICFVLTVVLLLASLSGCWIMEPPGIVKVEKVFRRCYDDIQIVVDFMISSEYEEYEIIRIDSEGCIGLLNTDGYHMESVELVLDQETEEAVKRLLDSEYEYINKVQDTILLQQWHWMTDVGCGVAYAIDHQDLPEVQYVTELIPMETEGWYYYVDDYNQWCLENK